MHLAAIQFLTWGTVAGAIASALLLAMLEPAASAAAAGGASFTLPHEPTQAGRKSGLRASPSAAASSPAVAVR